MVPLQPFCALEHQAGTMDVTVEVMTYGAEDRFSQKKRLHRTVLSHDFPVTLG